MPQGPTIWCEQQTNKTNNRLPEASDFGAQPWPAQMLFGILKELAPCQVGCPVPRTPPPHTQRPNWFPLKTEREQSMEHWGQQEPGGHRQFVAGRDSLMSVGLDCQRELWMTDGHGHVLPHFFSMGSNCARGGSGLNKKCDVYRWACHIDFMAQNARRWTTKKKRRKKEKPKASNSDGHSSGMWKLALLGLRPTTSGPQIKQGALKPSKSVFHSTRLKIDLSSFHYS